MLEAMMELNIALFARGGWAAVLNGTNAITSAGGLVFNP